MSRYNRSSFGSIGPGGISPAVKTLIIVCCVVFLLQQVDQLAGGAVFTREFGLVPFQVTHQFFIWQLLTYIFLHGGLLHILFNMLFLWMFGTDLERMWGKQTFTKFFFLCGVGGAVFKTVLSPSSLQATVGASGAILGLLVAYGFLFPENQIILYIFPIKVKWFVIGYAVITVLSSLQAGSSTDYRVHLGGMLTALVYMKGGRILPDLKSRYDRWHRNRLRRKFEVYYNERRRNDDQEKRRWRN